MTNTPQDWNYWGQFISFKCNTIKNLQITAGPQNGHIVSNITEDNHQLVSVLWIQILGRSAHIHTLGVETVVRSIVVAYLGNIFNFERKIPVFLGNIYLVS